MHTWYQSFQGLEISPTHWPCLDNLVSLLYALNNYEGVTSLALLHWRWQQQIFVAGCPFIFSLHPLPMWKLCHGPWLCERLGTPQAHVDWAAMSEEPFLFQLQNTVSWSLPLFDLGWKVLSIFLDIVTQLSWCRKSLSSSHSMSSSHPPPEILFIIPFFYPLL